MPGRAKKILWLLLAVALLAAVVPLQREMNRDRNRLGLTRQEPLENTPPVLAFTTVALGGFRGLIANALWIRMSELQDEDKFFEMQQLADWITKLEPHYTQVWLVQGWNMAYNISVKFKETAPGEFPDRWRWVRGGIRLLRDDGLRYNPHDVLIHRELAWFFQHKMGQNLDDANMYYKHHWAMEMSRVFGGEKPDFDELIHPQTEAARQRVQVLTNDFKMDPAFIKHVQERYGPLEWRLPEAHAIYWAAKGLDMAKNYPEKVKPEDLVQLRRVIFQSMQASFRHGRLVTRSLTNGISFGPNLDIIPTVNRSYEEAIEQTPEMRENIMSAHRNLIRDAVYFLYTGNRVADAADWFRYLGQKYPNKTLIDGKTNSWPRNTTLQEFALSRVMEDVGETSQERVQGHLEGFVGSAYLAAIRGDVGLYEGYRKMARDLWARFMKEIGDAGAVRVGLPPLAETEQKVLGRMLDPKEGLPPEMRAILRTELRLPPEAESTNAPPSAAASPAPANTNSPATTNR